MIMIKWNDKKLFVITAKIRDDAFAHILLTICFIYSIIKFSNGGYSIYYFAIIYIVYAYFITKYLDKIIQEND